MPFPVHTLWREPQTRSCLWKSWLPYILTAHDRDSNGAACVYVYIKARHCMLSTNRTYWGIPVSFLRSWQLTSTANTASNSAGDRTIQSNPISKGHWLDSWLWTFVWLEVPVMNYLQVHDLMLVYQIWWYKYNHEPVVIARVCLCGM